ncbi:hypothetical protein SAMN05720465_1164 [Fibrobacter sp. UWB10]|nr:hypothetical protein SAMN05720465_1164 [Fibrobacter sp. UWB10]
MLGTEVGLQAILFHSPYAFIDITNVISDEFNKVPYCEERSVSACTARSHGRSGMFALRSGSRLRFSRTQKELVSQGVVSIHHTTDWLKHIFST